MHSKEVPSQQDYRSFDHAHGLTSDERTSVEQGRLFRQLPSELRDAILGRAYVWRLKDGQRVISENEPAEYWLGVASGELVGRVRSPENGQTMATHVLAPGVWLNLYSPLCDVGERGIEFVAGGPSCFLALSKADLLDLCSRWPDLLATKLLLSALNLRYAQLVMQESQSCTLEQKMLRWLDAAVNFKYAGREASGWVYRSLVPQAELAAGFGVSRQSWNGGMARLEAAGLIRRLKDGLSVPDPTLLEAALRRHGLRGTARYLQVESQPTLPAVSLPIESLPLSSLRSDERAVLPDLRWCKDLRPALRDALLSQMRVLRIPDKTLLAADDRLPPGWICLVRGGLRLVCAPVPPSDADVLAAPQTARQRPVRTVFAQLRPGGTVLEHALIDGGNCGIEVHSEGDSTLLLMEPDAFRALLAAEPEFARCVLQWLSFSHHQIGLLGLILTLPMPLRLHAWLDLNGRRRGWVEGAWLHIPMTLSQQEIARWLSTTRQYVAKAVSELEGAGTLVRRRGSYLLRRDALPWRAHRPN